MGLERASWRAGLLKGLIWSAGFGAVALLGCAVLHALKIDPLQLLPPARPARPPTLALLFLVAGLIAPMAEEFYFRGLIYGYCRRWGFWPALGVSTLIFTLLHTGVAAFPLTQLIGGLVFATAYEIEKKLMVPITIHVLGNLALFGLAYV
jgi:membrane protease YdiL (CAAX protease family)